MGESLRRFCVSTLGLVVCLGGFAVESARATENCFTPSCVWGCPDEELMTQYCHQGCGPDYSYGCFPTTHCELGMSEPFCWDGGPD